jgi:hypothetical protein
MFTIPVSCCTRLSLSAASPLSWKHIILSPSCHLGNTAETLRITGYFLLRPSSGILKTKEQNVSETGSVSFLRSVGETPTLLDTLERDILNHWTTHVGRLNSCWFSPAQSFLASVSSRSIDMYVVRNGPSSSTKEGSVFLCRR